MCAYVNPNRKVLVLVLLRGLHIIESLKSSRIVNVQRNNYANDSRLRLQVQLLLHGLVLGTGIDRLAATSQLLQDLLRALTYLHEIWPLIGIHVPALQKKSKRGNHKCNFAAILS